MQYARAHFDELSTHKGNFLRIVLKDGLYFYELSLIVRIVTLIELLTIL